ncbi:MAG: hypothetical protein KAR47_04185, partial [Planctomycetes bacterium]|nr:hypothetical protein [Planctomycetota bacterium]
SRSGKAKIAKKSKPANDPSKDAKKEMKKDAKMDIKTEGSRTLAEQLEHAKMRAKNLGKTFDPEQSTRWFNAKDTNKDGLLDEQEQKAKAPVGWNDK